MFSLPTYVYFISRLQDDLATLTRENQDINIELDNAMRDKNELKRQVEDYLLRVSSLDGNIASKVS